MHVCICVCVCVCSESMLRVWDLLLFEGSKALFRTSLALLSINAKTLSDLATAVQQVLVAVFVAVPVPVPVLVAVAVAALVAAAV